MNTKSPSTEPLGSIPTNDARARCAALSLLAALSLSGCDRGVDKSQPPVEPVEASDITPFRGDFYNTLATNAVKAYASAQGMADPLPLDTGSAGQFPFVWENDDLKFNLNTYDFINTLVKQKPSGGTDGSTQGLSLQADTVSNATDSLYRNLTYQLSAADENALRTAQANSDKDIQVLVTDWNTSIGPIPVQTPPNTDIDYILAQVLTWSSQKVTLKQLQQAEELSDLLDKAPIAGQSLLPQIALVLQDLGASVDLQDQITDAAFILEHLKKNTEHPSSDNGGMTTVDHNGQTALHVGYTINRSVADIEGDLENTSSSVSISMTASKKDEKTMSVSLEGGGGILLDLEDFFVEGEGSASAHIFSSKGSGTDVSISVSYDGLSVVPITPVLFAQDTLKGWFDNEWLEQAHHNGVKPDGTVPTSGYYWRDQPAYKLGQDYGYISELLISNYPTFSITYTKGDYSTFKTDFKTQSEACVTFLFIPFACGEQNSYASSLSEQAEDGSFTVTYKPSSTVVASPAASLDKRAYVVAASATWPGVGTSGS